MKINLLKPQKALKKTYLKIKPNRIDIEVFKSNLVQLLERINDKESEEFQNKMTTFENNLTEMFAESSALEKKIQENLKTLKME